MAETKTLRTQILLRNDSAANWETQNPVLGKGECGIELDTNNKPIKFKFGDGKTAWKDLAYVGTSIKIEGEGDVIIGAEVNAAGELVLTKGKISADKVYFDKDITATYAFGKYAPDATGSVTIPANGKSVAGLFIDSLAEEQNPTITQPTATLNSSNIGAKEVGTNVAIAYSFSTNPGKYSFGPETGVTFSGHEATFNDETLTGVSGTFASVQVTDTTNLSITGRCSSTNGAIPKTNIGNEYAAGQIKAKSYTPSKGVLTGFRGWFYGYYNGTQALGNAAAITSDQLRSFGVKTSFPGQMTTNKMQQMFFAAPKGKKTSLSISNAVNGAPLTVTKTSVMVEGANNYEAIEYDLFYVANAVAESGESKWNIK